MATRGNQQKFGATIQAENLDEAIMKLRDNVRELRGMIVNMLSNVAFARLCQQNGVKLIIKHRSKRDQDKFNKGLVVLLEQILVFLRLFKQKVYN